MTVIDLAPLRAQNRRSLDEAWWAPVIDADRESAWRATRERIHSAIVRARLSDGYEGASVSALGDHLYLTAADSRARRAS